MEHLLNLAPAAWKDWFREQGEPAFRARQLQNWVFSRRANGFTEMSDLPLRTRSRLEESFSLWTTEIAEQTHSSDGTEKLLLRLSDGHDIECVLLRDGPRRTVCVSSQVGCAMGCVFCASGLDGVVRSLTMGEIVEQVLRLDRLLGDEERLSHIVMMGMGEPLANLPQVTAALKTVCRPEALNISARRVTISTVGLPEGIRRLAKQGCPYHLAVSLHAPEDELRSRLVPVNQNTGIDAILQAADDYFRATGRRLTFEYVLLSGINDQPSHARQLAELLRERTALLNLIPFNPVSGLPYRAPSVAALQAFREVLESHGIPIRVRKRKGSRIDAACGQLRRLRSLQNSSASPR